MRSRLGVCLLAIGLVGCTAVPVAHGLVTPSSSPTIAVSESPTASPATPAAVPSATPAVPPAAACRASASTGAATPVALYGASDGLHLVSAANGNYSDAVIGCGGLLAANRTLVVTLISMDGAYAVQYSYLGSRVARVLTTFAQLGFVIDGPVGAVLSPDGSTLAIAGQHHLDLVSIPSGSIRALASEDTEHWLIPLVWTNAGIAANETGYEEIGGDMVRVDPQNGTISPLDGNAAMAFSTDGRLIAYGRYVDMGDGSSGGQGPWQNTLHVAVLGGADVVLKREANRNLVPLDLANDGELLFESDTGPGGSVAPDMGLYLATSGQIVQQVPVAFYGEWGNGLLLNSSTALVSRIAGGGLGTESAVELVLVHLCPDSSVACHVTTSVVSSIPAGWPTEIGRIVTIGPPA